MARTRLPGSGHRMTSESALDAPSPGVSARARRHQRLYPLMLATALATAMLATRLWGLTHSLWWDEAYTAWAYISRPGAIRDPDSYLGNNHVLFSWLSHHTTELTGSTWEPVIRFWSVVPGLVATGILVTWLWRRVSVHLALVTLGLLYVSELHARHVPEARGYGLVLLGSTLLIVAGVEASRPRPPRSGDVAFVAGGAIGVAAIPTLAVAAIPQGLTALVRRGERRVRLAALGVVSGLVLAAWYWPLREPMLHYRASVGSRTGDSVTLWNLFTLPLEHLGVQPTSTLLSGRPGLFTLVATALLFALGVHNLVVNHRDLGLQVVAGLIGSMVMLGLLGIHIETRYVFFLLPHVVLAIAAGMLRIAHAAMSRLPSRLAVLLLTLLVVIATARGTSDVVDERRLPRQAFANSVEAVMASGVDRLYTDRLHIGFRWYLGDEASDVITFESDAPHHEICRTSGSAAYLPYPGHTSLPSCLDGDPWQYINPPSRFETPVWIRVEGLDEGARDNASDEPGR